MKVVGKLQGTTLRPRPVDLRASHYDDHRIVDAKRAPSADAPILRAGMLGIRSSSLLTALHLWKPLGSVLAIAVWLVLGFPMALAAQRSPEGAGRGVNPILQPGDLIRLKIWREPDLSGDYRVDENGVAIFPKIGPLPVSQLSTDSLKSLLVSSYNAYLQNPAVEVTFLRRINVLGEVKSPGLYDVDPTMTVADVVAMAGGVTPDGNSKKIELLRRGQPGSAQIKPHSRLADSSLRSGDQLRVPQRSWLSRNGTVVAASVTAVALIATAVIR
jgi:polysaccharide biosynthesis/export protein